MPLKHTVLLGFCAGLASALIGAGWQIVSRSAALTPLGPVELAVLRYAIPAIVLLPVLWRIGLVPQAVSPYALVALVCCGGLPFGLLALVGTRFAPAAHMGVMMAAMGPIFTALLLWIIERARLTALRGAGLALIACGVLLLGVSSLVAGAQTWIGDLLFLAAALVWGGYGIAFRASGLTPWQGAAIVNAWSSIVLLPLAYFVGVPGFYQADTATLALQATAQGLVAGVFGLVSYTAAVKYLGAGSAAAFGALVPVLSAVGGWLLLSEAMTPLVALASCLATLGVALAVGAFKPKLSNKT